MVLLLLPFCPSHTSPAAFTTFPLILRTPPVLIPFDRRVLSQSTALAPLPCSLTSNASVPATFREQRLGPPSLGKSPIQPSAVLSIILVRSQDRFRRFRTLFSLHIVTQHSISTLSSRLPTLGLEHFLLGRLPTFGERLPSLHLASNPFYAAATCALLKATSSQLNARTTH